MLIFTPKTITACSALVLAPVLATPGISARPLMTNYEPSDDNAPSVGESRDLVALSAPFLPQFNNVDWGQAMSFLTKPDTISVILFRDFTQTAVSMGFWILLHSLFWRGKLERNSDLPFPLSLLDLGSGGGLSSKSGAEEANSQSPAQDKLNPQSLSQISTNGLINFLTDPSFVAVNLILGAGFGFFSALAWILPSFLWTGTPLPEEDFLTRTDHLGSNGDLGGEISSKLVSIEDKLDNANLVNVWNEAMCPQCVATYILIIAVLFIGRLMFWALMTILPQTWPQIFLRPLNGGVSVGRSFDSAQSSVPPPPRTTAAQVSTPASGLQSAQLALLFFLDEIDERIETIAKTAAASNNNPFLDGAQMHD